MKLAKFIEGPIKNGDISKLLSANDPASGAVLSFNGVVRADIVESQLVQSIDFTTDKDISLNIMKGILNDFSERYRLNNVAILHSTGNIPVGQTCFYVMVSASHRKEAFGALEEIVNSFKKNVPVFGKEILENDNYVWKTNSE